MLAVIMNIVVSESIHLDDGNHDAIHYVLLAWLEKVKYIEATPQCFRTSGNLDPDDEAPQLHGVRNRNCVRN